MRRVVLFLTVFFLSLNAAAFWVNQTLPARSYLNPDIYVWTSKHDKLASGALAHHDCLLVGDSQIMGGVLPSILASRTGMKCYNLGLPAMKVRGLSAQLSLIQRHAPSVRTLIVNVSPIFLFRGDVERVFNTYAGHDLAVRVFPAFQKQLGISHSAGDVLNTVLLRLPVMHLHETIGPYISASERYGAVEIPASAKGEVLTRSLQTSLNPRQSAQMTRKRNEAVESILEAGDGHWIWKTAQEPACPTGIERSTLPGLAPYQDDPEARPALSDFVAQAERRGINIIIARIPLSRTWESSTNPRDAYSRMNNVLASVKQEHPNILIVPEVDAAFRDRSGVFHDWTHLSMCGARQYTGFLASALK